MIFPITNAEAPKLVEAVQRFRGRIYLAEGAIAELSEDGRHIEPADETAYHLVITGLNGAIRACIRYQQIGRGRSRIGGWAVDPEARYSRDGIRLVMEVLRLAERLGDHYGTATATERNHSADILRRMGGRLLMRYYDPAYRCEMELLEFRLGEMQVATKPHAAIAA